MFNPIKLITFFLSAIAITNTYSTELDNCKIVEQNSAQNNCISFSVSQGTGCSWMCNYCANQLGTNNYYFSDGVCKYASGGCEGNPIAGKTYTCCSA